MGCRWPDYLEICQLLRSPQAPITLSPLRQHCLAHVPACNGHNFRNYPLQSSPHDTSSAHSPSTDSHPPACLRHSSSRDSLPVRVSRHRYCAGVRRLWRRDSVPILPLRRQGLSPRLVLGDGLECFWIRHYVLGWRGAINKSRRRVEKWSHLGCGS